MEEFDVSKITPPQHNDAAIPFDDSDKHNVDVSHTPLALGGSGSEVPPKPKSAVKPAPTAAPKANNPTSQPGTNALAGQERITGVKTFFTKLHAGAIEFLDGQIIRWLEKNPGITIKRTNTATGDVVGKKTEPSILVTVWY